MTFYDYCASDVSRCAAQAVAIRIELAKAHLATRERKRASAALAEAQSLAEDRPAARGSPAFAARGQRWSFLQRLESNTNTRKTF